MGGVTAGPGHTGFSAGGQISGSIAAATAGPGGGAAHPASTTAASAAAAMADNGRIAGEEVFVGWVFLEIAVALAIAAAIVWWTFPNKPRGGDKDGEG